jgi:hypothetical protein
MRDGVGDAPGLAAPVVGVASPLANSLKQVVEKTKVIVAFIDKTAKVSIGFGPWMSSILTSLLP